MTTQANLVQTGVDRFRSAVRSLDDEFQRLQKQLASGRRTLERELGGRRKRLEREARKQVTQLSKNPLVKRAVALREGAVERIEDGVSLVLGTFQIASKSDLERLDRKLTQLGRKIRDLEKGRTNGSGSL